MDAVALSEKGFVPMTDGNLDAWKYESGDEGDNWILANGVLKHTGEKGKTIDLWSKESFKDFTLVLDWRWAQKGDMRPRPVVLPDGTEKLGPDGKKLKVEIEELDSGVFLRGSAKNQVNLWNWNVGSGEMYGYRTDQKQSAEVRAAVTPKRKADNPVGEWNRMMITVEGKTVSVSLNGDAVIESATLGEMEEEGPIALQHHGQAVDFANIWVRRD